MNVDLGIWGRLTRLIIGLLCLAAVMGVVVWYLPVIKQNERMRQEIHRLDMEIAEEQAKVVQQERTIDALRNDPKAVERLARERLGYAKPGETTFRFESR